MKQPWSLVTVLQVLYVLTGFDGTGAEDYSYNYNNNNPDPAPQPDFVNEGMNEGVPVTNTCYNCAYHYINGKESGYENCRDPFIDKGINRIADCIGACSKTYTKVSETGYHLSRTCLPNCEPSKFDDGYVQCCYGPLCNASTRLQPFQPATLLILLATVTACVCRLLMSPCCR